MLLSNNSQIHWAIFWTIFAASRCLLQNVELFDHVITFELFEVSEPLVNFNTDSDCCFVLLEFPEKKEGFFVGKTAQGKSPPFDEVAFAKAPIDR